MRYAPLIVLLLTGYAAADPPKLAKVTASDLPGGVTASGPTLDQAWKYVDKAGTNYVLFSEKRSETGTGMGAERSATLYVDDWLVPAKGKPKNLLPVREVVEHCNLALTARFHDDALEVTDLDKDGIGEITFAYETNCASDVRPATYKVLTLQNGTMYILRGHTRIADPDQPGGDYGADPIFKKAPAAFLDHAKQVWQKTADDSESPPKRKP